MTEPNLDFLAIPETFGGFGPDFVWQGLHQMLVSEVSENDGPGTAKKPDACSPCSNCL